MIRILLPLLFVSLPCLGQIKVTPLGGLTFPFYQISDPTHGVILNETRRQKGSASLERVAELDSLALARCRRLARRLEDSLVDPLRIFSAEGHRDASTAENTGIKIWGTSFFPAKLGRPSADSVRTLYLQETQLFRDAPSGHFYDDSPAHTRNRTNPQRTQFGEASVLLLLPIKKNPDEKSVWAPEVAVKLIWLNYEVFR